MDSIVSNKYQQALSSCKVAEIESPAAHFGQRLETVHKLLNNYPSLRIQFIQQIVKILESNKNKVNLHDTEDSAKVHVHVKMVHKNLVAGSLRQSLQVALEVLVIQALAHLIRKLDANFNMSTLYSTEYSEKLWLSLLQSPTIFNIDKICASAFIGGEDAYVHPELVQNFGQFGPFAAKFPFSHKIIEILNDRKTRVTVEEYIGEDPAETLNNVASNIFGSSIVELFKQFSGKEFEKYFHDLVAISAFALPGLSFESTLNIYEKVIRLTRNDCLSSLGGLHTCIWSSESRLFRCCSIVANLFIGQQTRDVLIETIKCIPSSKEGDSNSKDAIQNRLAIFDGYFLNKVLSELWNDNKVENLQVLSTWLQKLSSLRADIEHFILLLSSNIDEEQILIEDITIDKLRNEYVALQVVKVFLQEIVQPILSHGRKVAGEFTNKFFEITKNIKVTEESSFIELVELCNKYLPSDVSKLTSSFARRYLQEILFGEQEGFLNISSNFPLSESYISFLNRLLNKAQNEREGTFKELLDVPMQKIVLHCLLKAEERGIIKQKHTVSFESVETIQLFLQYQCDKLTSDNQQWRTFIEDDGERVIQLSKKEVNKASELSSEEWYNYLQCLAKSIMHLREYSNELLEVLTKGNVAGVTPLHELVSTNELLTYQHAVKLTLKYLKHFGDFEGITQAIHLPHDLLKWLPFDRKLVGKNPIPDPFPWLKNKQEYEAVCAAVRSVATNEEGNKTYFTNSKSAFTPNLLLGALLSQTVLFTTSLVPNGMNALGECVRDYILHTNTAKGALPFYEWVLSGCDNAGEFKEYSQSRLLQIGVHLSILGLSHQQSWIFAMLFHPESQLNSYLLGLPDDEFTEIVRASGLVGWYVCPNGHKYSVGNCTKPMEKSVCTACNAPIGGLQHVSVEGVRRLQETELAAESKRGYTVESSELECVRLSPLTSRILRLLLHMSMLLSSYITPDNFQIIKQLCFNKENFQEVLFNRMKYDWDRVKAITGLTDGRLTIALHMLIKEFQNHSHSTAIFTSLEYRNSEEKRLAHIIEQVLANNNLKLKIDTAINELQKSGETSVIRIAGGDQLWYELHENQFMANPKQVPLTTLLWRLREPVSYEHFNRFCELNSTLIEEKHSLLKQFLKSEKLLQSLQGIADILAWHRILFEIFPHMSISRTDALEKSNKQVIELLPEDRQPYAREILQRFCRTFNTVFPSIELLYECNANPFINAKTGRVDFGDGTEMDENTSVAFSLPSIVTGSDQGDFINGVCTIRLLDLLAESQNSILDSINEKKVARRQQQGALAVAEQDHQKLDIPAINYLTPDKVLQSQLIIYDRHVQLQSLIRIFSIQSLEYGTGSSLDYELQKIEDAIANGILAGKTYVNLFITHFQYKGDIKRMGHLESLSSKIPQELLPTSVMETISAEIDTLEKLNKLMQRIELCISLIVAVGSQNTQISGDSSLGEYLTQTLRVPQEEWDEISTPTIKQQIYLRNLQSFYILLEEKTRGNPLDTVLSQFCEPLTAQQTNKIKLIANKLNLSELNPIFRRLLLDRLVTDVPPKENLKVYIEATSDQYTWAPFLEECDWWVHFPANFELRNAKAVYTLLEECRL